MKAIVIEKAGGPEVLVMAEVPEPEPVRGEVRVRVRATSVNRADVLQRKGMYPAPAGVPQDIPGLEFAGEVDSVGEGVVEWKPGDRVFGLAGGGTYAEKLVVPAGTLARMPRTLDFVQAAAVPEAFVTAYDAMVLQGGLAAGRSVLVTAVGSGVGTAAVQIARAIGARAFGTARTADKLERAKALGMTSGLVPEQGRFGTRMQALSDGGVDVVLELVGGPYVQQDLECTRVGGTIMLVGLMAGRSAEIDLGTILRKRLHVVGTVLRARPLEEKILAAKALDENLAPLFDDGRLSAVVDTVLPLSSARQAHEAMESNASFGKIVLEVGTSAVA